MYYFKAALMLALSFGVMTVCKAQQIKDGETVDLNGLAVTYRVISKEQVNVKGQTFDRYKIVASVQNNTGKSFNIRLASAGLGSSLVNTESGSLVELNCVNATGARLTSKFLKVRMKPHQVAVSYYTKNSDCKTIESSTTITAGYYLDAGQMAENDAIFIVPQGETPNVNVRPLK
jgi:hypothetical protein